MIFLICYAFGCELWAPWSEELGRRWTLQASLFLVNSMSAHTTIRKRIYADFVCLVWQVLAALAPNFGSIIVARALGGLSSAGGSVTLGMVADLYSPNEQQYAVAYIVFASVFGSVIGPIVGPFIQVHLSWSVFTPVGYVSPC